MDLNDLAFFGIAPGIVMSGSGGVHAGEDEWKFLTPQQKRRLKKISEWRMLFQGLHREYFLDGGRTQFSFANLRVSGIYGEHDRQLYIADNILGLDSVKSADLLYGEEPILRVAAPASAAGGEAYVAIQEIAQRDFLRELTGRCNLGALFHEKAVDASVDGESFIEARLENGKVWLVGIPSWEIFPMGQAGPDQQYASYDRYRMGQIGTEEKPIFILLITHYRAGSIDRELWQLENGQKLMLLSLDQWPLDANEPPLLPSTPTGLDSPTVVRIVNQMRDGQAANDYAPSVVALQDAYNAKMSQLAWVIARHAQPKLAVHSARAQADSNLSSGYDVEYFNNPDEKSTYITWEARLDAADKDRAFTLGQLLMALESSPVLLGINLGENAAHATAFKSFRLMATSPLAKAARKSNYQKSGVARALDLACRLGQQVPGVRFDIYPVAVTLRDGIPLDALEEAQRIVTLKGGGVMSLRRAINEQIVDPAEAADELEEIKAENEAALPTVLLQPPGPGGEEATTQQVVETEADAATAESAQAA